jgi:hypothetical protein
MPVGACGEVDISVHPLLPSNVVLLNLLHLKGESECKPKGSNQNSYFAPIAFAATKRLRKTSTSCSQLLKPLIRTHGLNHRGATSNVNASSQEDHVTRLRSMVGSFRMYSMDRMNKSSNPAYRCLRKDMDRMKKS